MAFQLNKVLTLLLPSTRLTLTITHCNYAPCNVTCGLSHCSSPKWHHSLQPLITHFILATSFFFVKFFVLVIQALSSFILFGVLRHF